MDATQVLAVTGALVVLYELWELRWLRAGVRELRARGDAAERRGDAICAVLGLSQNAKGEWAHTGGQTLLKSGVDPRDAVEAREAKKFERQRAMLAAAAEAEAHLVAKFGEGVLAIKGFIEPQKWDAAMAGGVGSAVRLVAPFVQQNKEDPLAQFRR